MVGGGKKKIEIKRILDQSKRRVTFSKRRKGLFKKASELDILCGSDTAIISVSEAGTIFTAGRPSLVHGLFLDGASVGGGGRLDCMGWEELATHLAAVKKARHKIELLMMERRSSNNNNDDAAVSDFTGDPIAAFSSASATSEKVHVFVDAAAPPETETPASTTPLSSELETGGCSHGAGAEDYGFVDMMMQEELDDFLMIGGAGGGCWSAEEEEVKYQELLALLQ